MRTRRLVGLVFLLGAVIGLACDGYLDEDPTGTVVPPSLVGFELDPDSVNITESPDTSTARTAVEAATGVDSAQVRLVGPDGDQTASCVARSAVEDGDVSRLECQVVLSPTDRTGTWSVARLTVHVPDADPLDLDLDALDVAGYPTALDVARDSSLTPAPTGELVFVSERTGTREFFRIAADGSGLTQLTTSVNNSRPRWSPDGSRIAYGDGGDRGVWVMNSDGSAIQQLTDYPSGAPSWSPDGSELAIQASDGSDWEVLVIDPATGDTLRVLTDNTVPDQFPAWSPDGSEIAVVRDNVLTRIQASDGVTVQSYDVGGRSPVWSPDGSEIAVSQPLASGYQIVIVDVASGSTRQLTTDSAAHIHPAWSPDGRYIAYARAAEFSAEYDIYLALADGSGDPTLLTSDPATDFYPDWTDSVTVPANQAPTATINSPADSASYVSGDTIVFDGTGSDPEDGTLTGSSLEWTSDLDGVLGTGTTVSVSNLSEGSHTITLTATDSEGATGTATVTITVQGTTDLGVSMTASPDPVEADSTLSHAIDIGNAGPEPVTDLRWTLLVEGDVLISSPNQEGCDDFTSSDPPSKLFDCTIDSLAVDEVLNFQLDVVPQQVDETLVSTVTLESWTGAVDPDLSNNTAVDSTAVEGPSGAPTATITAPADSSLYSQESTITFEGSGSDPEDGALADSALVWTSDIDGDIGVGTSLSIGSLSVGTHTITLTATDSDGLTGTDSVVVGIAMAMGTNHQDSIAGQGDTDRFPFRADSGDVINVGYLNETLDGRVYVTVLDSTGAQLRQVRSPDPLYGNYVETDLLELTASGWYFIDITGVDSGSAGVYRIGLSRVSPPTAIGLAVPYADASGTMSVIGQRQYFSFENSADAVMNFAALTPESDVWLYVYICTPGTTPYWDRSCLTNFRTTGGSNESGRQVLPEGGTYIIEVRGTGNAFENFQGAYDLRAFVPALTPVLMDQTYTDSITPAYDLDRFSVDHPTELPAFLVRTEHAYSGYINTYVYSDPTTQIDWDRSFTPSYATESAHEVGPLLLDAGTYLIEQDASGPGTASYSFNVVTIEPPVTMTDSARVDGSIDQSGERDYFEITGTAGQQLEVEITSGTDHNGNVRVYPLPADGDYTTRDTSPLTSFGYDAVSIVADTVTLPSDTSYIIEVDGGRYGIGASTGQYSLFTSFVPAEETTGSLYVAVESDNAMAVVDTATNTVATTITVPQWPWAVAVAPDGSEVYTASRNDGSFTFLDAATNTVDTTIANVVNDPFDMAISPDGATVYVLDNNTGRVAVIDVATRAVTGELLGATTLPNALALDPSGDTAFVVAGDTVVAFDIATETAIDTLTGAFALPADGAVTPDGTELVFTDFDNNRLVIVDRATFTVVDSVTGIAEPRGMAITSDGATAWVAARSGSSLVPVDIASRTAGSAISLPFQPYWVAVTSDGATAYVTEGRGGTEMAVVDLATGSVTTTITMGDGPAQIGIRP